MMKTIEEMTKSKTHAFTSTTTMMMMMMANGCASNISKYIQMVVPIQTQETPKAGTPFVKQRTHP